MFFFLIYFLFLFFYEAWHFFTFKANVILDKLLSKHKQNQFSWESLIFKHFLACTESKRSCSYSQLLVSECALACNRNQPNQFDAAIVISGLVEVAASFTGQGKATGVSVLRTLRAFRLFRLGRYSNCFILAPLTFWQ